MIKTMHVKRGVDLETFSPTLTTTFTVTYENLMDSIAINGKMETARMLGEELFVELREHTLYSDKTKG